VALLKELQPDLTPDKYKQILQSTSISMQYYDRHFQKNYECPRVVDIYAAVMSLDNRLATREEEAL
jgi:hypothetical protein